MRAVVGAPPGRRTPGQAPGPSTAPPDIPRMPGSAKGLRVADCLQEEGAAKAIAIPAPAKADSDRS